MGLLGKIQNKTRHVFVGVLKHGRDQESSINNKLKRIDSNNYDPISATALKAIAKFNELTEIPFRKANKYLYDKLAPSTTDENKNVEINERNKHISDKENLRNRINAKRLTPLEALELQNNDDE